MCTICMGTSSGSSYYLCVAPARITMLPITHILAPTTHPGLCCSATALISVVSCWLARRIFINKYTQYRLLYSNNQIRNNVPSFKNAVQLRIIIYNI